VGKEEDEDNSLRAQDYKSKMDDDALYNINNAIRLYEDLGAIAKVEQLKEKHMTLLGHISEIEATHFSICCQSLMIDDQSSGKKSGIKI
jgi:hypothetical protein